MAQSIQAQLLLTPFGKYTLLSRLSFGGMAELFLAVQHFSLGFQKLVVVKRILPSRRNDPAFVGLFLREACIAAALSHPNVVQTFDAGEVDGSYFIVMEHVAGEDLRAVLRAIKQTGAEAFPIEHALQVALGACAGLGYVHEKRDLDGEELRIVHGDISTHNVLLSFEGDVKLVDFGIATSDGGQRSLGGVRESRRIKGKPRYMSPEQAIGQALDGRADVFSLGVVLFELTTGRRLFHTNSRSLETGTRDRAYIRPSDAAPAYPPLLERIVLRALEPDRGDRYPSARAFQADLEEFARIEGIHVSPLATRAWMNLLFEEKIQRDRDVWRGINDLVTTVGPLPELLPAERGVGGGAPVATTAGDSIAPHAIQTPRSPRWSGGASMVAATGVLALVATVGYMRHDTSVRLAQAAKMAVDEHQERPAPAPSSTGSLEIRSTPEASAVWLDGMRRTETTPTKIDGLPFGRELHVALVKDGFEPYRTTVTLSSDAPFKEVDGDLRKVAATLVVQYPPPVVVEMYLDGKRWTGSHSRIEGLAPDQDHLLALSAPGYLPKSFRVSLKPGETRALSVFLVKEPP